RGGGQGGRSSGWRLAGQAAALVEGAWWWRGGPVRLAPMCRSWPVHPAAISSPAPGTARPTRRIAANHPGHRAPRLTVRAVAARASCPPHGDVVSFVALDLILRITFGGVMHAPHQANDGGHIPR